MNTADYLLSGAADDAVAVVDGEGAHTYGELRRAVAGMVAALEGLPRRARVGILGPNSFRWVVAYLAALSAGAVAVPIPHALPRDTVLDRLARVEVDAVLLGRREDRALGGRLPHGIRTVVGVPEVGADLESVPVVDDDDAVYVLTSGTTGAPRVVRLTHGNLQANTDAILGYLGLTPTDRVLVVLPFSYVFGASLLHTHLRVGATLVIQPDTVFAQSVVDRLRDEACTGFAGVPSTFHLLLRSSAFSRTPLPDLRIIQQAGGKLARPLLDELVRAQPQARVFVMYGQTEATARLSYLPPEELTHHPGSIGRGIPGVALRVVTPEGRPVVPGEVGEIWASGRNISPGYLDDPEATRRKMPDGILHTGDLATVDDEGYIVIVDRQEDFLKPWGFRVGSQEVESAAIQLTDLVAVAAVGLPDEAAGERVELVAVRKRGSHIDEEQVLGHCRARLDRHAVPSRVHFVDRLPLNCNGKVVKSAVRELCLGATES
ncbi:MAG TPA: AMP-binding protein [Propionibacteriaceae bacterium]|nr:AMP-binding protein [Propionibacteriaceae bacterium]